MIRPLFCSSEYMVDDRGFILSKRGKPLKPSINHSGYQIVNLMIDGKRVGLGVHTAVRGDILMRIAFGYLNKVV